MVTVPWKAGPLSPVISTFSCSFLYRLPASCPPPPIKTGPALPAEGTNISDHLSLLPSFPGSYYPSPWLTSKLTVWKQANPPPSLLTLNMNVCQPRLQLILLAKFPFQIWKMIKKKHNSAFITHCPNSPILLETIIGAALISKQIPTNQVHTVQKNLGTQFLPWPAGNRT